jgi:pimeloyl-ACP methyl ester carboxylesterase
VLGATKAARTVVLALVVVVAALGATGCEPARTARKDRTVLFVHGWSGLGAGIDCNGTFGSLESSLRKAGFTGQMLTIGYYDSDSNCDVNLQDWGNVTNSTSWKDIAKVFSSYLYENFTKKGIVVDLVGHSMGGNIVRGAIQGSQAKEAGFTQGIKVEDVVTFGSPFAGAAWYTNLCLWGQCSQLKPGASDIKWLATNGDPQAVGGTEWTSFGSTTDDVVPADSALAIGIPDARKVRYSTVEHSDYMGNATAQARAAKALAEPNA